MLNANINVKTKNFNLLKLYTKDYYTWTITNAELLKKGKYWKTD
ncbi:MAG: DUF29 domain-containing protein [Deltaproteobacteria bacterium]|nr:DUF29 domain-containing protein [Deltaproteobacteria bacterium]